MLHQLGIEVTPVQKRAMMFEAIDLILKCWTAAEPFDYEGQFWHGKRIAVEPKPLQKPHMPVGLANSESIETARYAGEQGFLPLHYYYDTAARLKELGVAFEQGAQAAGKDPSRSAIRVARFVHVGESDESARDEVRVAWQENLKWAKDGPAIAHVVRGLPEGGTVDDVTFDYLVDAGIFFVGSPDTVRRQATRFYQDMAGFGVLLFAVGYTFATRAQRERSWRMFMREVAPELRKL